MELEPREQAQLQAEVAMSNFLTYSKKTVYAILALLFVVVVLFNSGVETDGKGNGCCYNGEQYNPSNLNVTKK